MVRLKKTTLPKKTELRTLRPMNRRHVQMLKSIRNVSLPSRIDREIVNISNNVIDLTIGMHKSVCEQRRGDRTRKLHWKLRDEDENKEPANIRYEQTVVFNYERRTKGGLISAGKLHDLVTNPNVYGIDGNVQGYKFKECRGKTIIHNEEQNGNERRETTIAINELTLRLFSQNEVGEIYEHLTGQKPKGRGYNRNKLVHDILSLSDRTRRMSEIVLEVVPIEIIPEMETQRLINEERNRLYDERGLSTNKTIFPPDPVETETTERIINAWVENQTAVAIEENGCAVCGKLTKSSQLHPLTELSETELDLLKIIPSKDIQCTKVERRGNDSTEEVINEPIVAKGLTHACSTCVSVLMKGKTPSDALANGLWIGDVPKELSCLSFFEKQLISKVRMLMFVMKSQASQRHKLRGNIMCFKAPTHKVYRSLPPPKKDMETLLAFVHIGSGPPNSNDMARLPVFVRRSKVKRALIWLKDNHEAYKDIEISEDNLNGYKDGEIPVEILYKECATPGNREPAATAIYDAEEEEGVGEGDCPFEVGGLTEDIIDDWDNPSAIKLAVLRQLHTGQPVLGVGRSQKPLSMLSKPEMIVSAFPCLFPYGLGGYGNVRGKARKRDMSFASWAKHMLMYYDKRFQYDETFTFFVFNLMQIREAAKGAFITTRRKDFDYVAKSLGTLKVETLDKLIRKVTSGVRADVTNREEAECLKVLRLLQSSSTHVYGSISAKRVMRKHLWSMVEQLGAPTWFITVSPPEHKSPICLYFADKALPFSLEKRTADRARQLIAQNPVAGARYFHYIVTMLIDFILGKAFEDRKGLFGPVDSYYGTVEQQGRLTLHVHMLVFVSNALPLDDVKKRLVSKDEEFKDRLLRYLESCHTGDYLPDIFSIDAIEADREARNVAFRLQQELPEPVPKGCDNRCGICVECLTREKWFESFPSKVNEIVRCSNRHTCSTASCKKNARADCKARFPRPLFPETTITEDGYVQMKKTEEYLNTYNPTMSYLTMCNTDVTCLRTGTACKALIAYITDYISKSELRTTTFHECIKHVLRQRELQPLVVNGSEEQNARILLLKMTNRLTTEQEIGSPFAALYILGQPDRYTNIDFVPVNWRQYVTLAHVNDNQRKKRKEGGVEVQREEDDEEGNEEDRVGIVKDKNGKFSMYQRTDDYVFRPLELEDISPYTFHIAYEVCRQTGRKDKRAGATEMFESDESENDLTSRVGHGDRDVDINDDREEEEDDPVQMHTPSEGSEIDEEQQNGAKEKHTTKRERRKSGKLKESERQEMMMQKFDSMMRRVKGRRRPNSSFEFADGHPNKNTHVVKRRRLQQGRRTLAHFSTPLPRKDGVDKEYYSATMMILFMPWRIPKQLLRDHHTWSQALRATTFNEHTERLIRNLNVLYECLDARDDYATQRKNDAARKDHTPPDENDCVDVNLLCIPDRLAANDERQRLYIIERLTSAGMMGRLKDTGDDDTRIFVPSNTKQPREYVEDIMKANTARVHTISTAPQNTSGYVDSTTDGVTLLTFNESTATAESRNLDSIMTTYIRNISERFNLNKEQDRALQIVCKNTLRVNGEKLKMYLSGVGGTGKSQVIKAIIAFFNETGRGRKLAVLAPTGTAASLIGGQTYHSFLRFSRNDDQRNDGKRIASDERERYMQRIREVQFIIIDEVSMIGCQDLFKISSRLASVRGAADEPFGGVHIMFSGDFGQLPPVQSTRLYTILKDIRSNSSDQVRAIGRSLWEQVTTVVVLRQNMRQCRSGTDDEKLRTLLSNIRYKACTREDEDFILSMIPYELGGKRNVPSIATRTSSVITGTNATRDAINDKCAARFAAETNQTLSTFYAIDKVKEKTGRNGATDWINSRLSDEEREILLDLPPSYTQKIPGKLQLCKGMPVILRKNEATALGMTNGAEGVVVGWTENERLNTRLPSLETLFVKLTNPITDLNIGSLPTNVVPIVSRPESIECRHQDGTIRSIIRHQVPINLNFAMTDYSSQGKTRKVNIVSLAHMRNHSAIYTALSRGTSAEETVILDIPDFSLIEGGLGDDPLAQEFRDTEILDEITTLMFEGRLNENVQGQTRSELIRTYVEYHQPILQHLHQSIAASTNDIGDRTVVVPIVNDIPTKKRKATGNNTSGSLEENTIDERASKQARTTNDIPSNEPNDHADRNGSRRSSNSTLTFRPLNWDRENWSCAYDSVLQAMYAMWLDGYTNLQRNPSMRDTFSSVREGRITFESVRDKFREEAHSQDPQQFPFGQVPIDVYDVMKRALNDDILVVAVVTSCPQCLNQKEVLYHMTGLNSMDNIELTQAVFSQAEGNTITASQYASRLLHQLRTREHIAACHDTSTTQLQFRRIPDVLPIEIDASWTITPAKTLKIDREDGQEQLTFKLAAIIYNGENHFTTYIMLKNGESYYYDGMHGKGIPLSRGTHTIFKDFQLESVYGVGDRTEAIGRNRKRAVVLLYGRSSTE